MKAGARIGWLSATMVVVANMVGTGAFTTLGFQLNYVSNIWSILLLWIIGGILALFGAFTYAELGVRLPKSGGEYHFLGQIFHPYLGYLSGWVSLTVGFAASVALAAMAIGAYLSPTYRTYSIVLACLAIVIISLVHSFNLRQSSWFQNGITLFKLAIMLVLVGAGLLLPASSVHLDWSTPTPQELLPPEAAIGLIFVFYAFSGWNAAAYITGEIKQPERNLPRALIVGTVLVSVLFLGLQLAFLRQVPLEQIRDRVDIGQIVATHMFGSSGGQVVVLLITALLLASISAMVWVGPRVGYAMARDHEGWQFFARLNRHGIPVRAVWLQAAISLFLVLTSSFEQVLLYSGFVLQLFTFLTVFGLFILRRRQPKASWQSPLYPIIQLIFLAFSAWALIYLLVSKPMESLLGLLNLVAGSIFYLWNRRGQVSEAKLPQGERTGPISSGDRNRIKANSLVDS